MTEPRPIIVWLRHDLRLHDHAALRAAAGAAPVLPVFVLDEASTRPLGAASRWWLHGSLRSLRSSIEKAGGRLVLRRGDTVEVLARLATAVGARGVYMTRHHQPGAATLEAKLRARLGDAHEVKRFGGAVLLEPDRFASRSGEPYRVFTPFWKALLAQLADLPAPPAMPEISWWLGSCMTDSLDDWQLEPHAPDWAAGLRRAWRRGEAAALERLEAFVGANIADYPLGRDRPDHAHTSRLSPRLCFGELSPRQVWAAVTAARAQGQVSGEAAGAFLRELGWREFSWHLLAHFPDLVTRNFRERFDAFPWIEDPDALAAWQRGQTGYPIVDAGMRELWLTGWMHNRVRMIVASFLTKHLLSDWRSGEAWFWDTLVDADSANNAASWQWVAGSGADAAPYFRIFNPVLQAQKFDPIGAYIGRWVPELAGLEARQRRAPWLVASAELAAAGVELGRSYPRPIVEHAVARARALAAYAAVKRS